MTVLTLSPETPVLIAGPTAAGKSALALEIATTQGGVIVNADAMQVYDGWRIVTARPDEPDLFKAEHRLYGHVPIDAVYSTGQWLREVTPLIQAGERPIIVGGTGLNFAALTEGLAEIPPTPAEVRHRGNLLRTDDLVSELDAATAANIDLANRARVQRAWEVQMATGRSLLSWQAETPAPVLDLADTACIVLNADRDWLANRIARRFDIMLSRGALDEAREVLPNWSSTNQSSKAIGAPELIAHLRGELTLSEARQAAIISSRQYAKRQRTWFRKRMKNWHQIDAQSTDLSTNIHFVD